MVDPGCVSATAAAWNTVHRGLLWEEEEVEVEVEEEEVQPMM
jgi:hypothetical protein